MSTSPSPVSSNFFDSCRSAGQTLVELMGCAKSGLPVTEETLKKEFYIVMTAGIISCALLAIGLIGQLGLFPIGNSAASAFTFSGGAGLLITVFAGYKYWKKVQAFEKEVQERIAKEAEAAAGNFVSAGANFIADRLSSLRGHLPSLLGGTPPATQ